MLTNAVLLLFEERFDGAFGECLSRGVGQVFPGGQIDVQPRSVRSEGVASHGFPPALI